MLSKAVISAIFLLGVSSFAMAQTSTTTPPAGSTSSTGSGMTEAQVKQQLEKEGYSNIELRPETGSTAGSGSSTAAKNDKNVAWEGTAMKGGKKVDIEIDHSGKVTNEK